MILVFKTRLFLKQYFDTGARQWNKALRLWVKPTIDWTILFIAYVCLTNPAAPMDQTNLSPAPMDQTNLSAAPLAWTNLSVASRGRTNISFATIVWTILLAP